MTILVEIKNKDFEFYPDGKTNHKKIQIIYISMGEKQGKRTIIENDGDILKPGQSCETHLWKGHRILLKEIE